LESSDLIDYLNDLRIALNSSGVERTTGLKKTMGKTCQYYKKSRDLFLDQDYDKIRNLFYQVEKQFNIVEGKRKEHEETSR